MYKWVQNTFALSEEGSRTFVRGVVWTFLHFVSLMFPMMMLFYFLMEQMGIGVFAGKTPHGTLFYVGIAAVLFIVMLVIYRFSYSATYSSVYDESMRRRVSIAEKLRKLPLSFFGKKNLSDLTSTIMDDCNALEMIFSHAVPELFAAIGSVTIIGLCCSATTGKCLSHFSGWCPQRLYSLRFPRKFRTAGSKIHITPAA